MQFVGLFFIQHMLKMPVFSAILNHKLSLCLWEHAGTTGEYYCNPWEKTLERRWGILLLSSRSNPKTTKFGEWKVCSSVTYIHFKCIQWFGIFTDFRLLFFFVFLTLINENIENKPSSVNSLFQASQTYGGRVVEWLLRGAGVHCRHSQPRRKELPRLAAQTVGHSSRCRSSCRVFLYKWGVSSSFLPTMSYSAINSLCINLVFCWYTVYVLLW